MLRFAVIAMLSFVGMELFSYLVHRFVYHRLLWVLHKSHHTRRTGLFEWNDIFPFVFAAVTIVLIMVSLKTPGGSDLLPAAIGISAYGLVYFFIHDLYVHRRAKSLSLKIPFLLRIKKAHAIHHRDGGEPYGLLLFVNTRRVEQVDVREDEPV